MILLTAVANRDERKFEYVDRFDIHRKIDHHATSATGCTIASVLRSRG